MPRRVFEDVGRSLVPCSDLGIGAGRPQPQTFTGPEESRTAVDLGHPFTLPDRAFVSRDRLSGIGYLEPKFVSIVLPPLPQQPASFRRVQQLQPPHCSAAQRLVRAPQLRLQHTECLRRAGLADELQQPTANAVVGFSAELQDQIVDMFSGDLPSTLEPILGRRGSRRRIILSARWNSSATAEG